MSDISYDTEHHDSGNSSGGGQGDAHQSGGLLQRALYMVLFAILFAVAEFVLWVLVVVQFVFAAIGGGPNAALRKLGSSLSLYLYQVVRYLTFNSEEKPFPLADWPEPEPAESR